MKYQVGDLVFYNSSYRKKGIIIRSSKTEFCVHWFIES